MSKFLIIQSYSAECAQKITRLIFGIDETIFCVYYQKLANTIL